MKHVFKRVMSLLLMVSILLGTSATAFAANVEYNENLDEGTLPEALPAQSINISEYTERLEEEEPDLNSVVLQNQDGTKTLYFFATPVKYVSDDGEIRDRSSELTPCNDDAFAYSADDNSVKAYYPHTLSDGSIVLEYDGNRISVAPIPLADSAEQPALAVKNGVLSNINNAVPDVALVEEAELSYLGVFGEGTEARYSPNLNGYKENIVLYTPPESNRFSFLVDAGGYTLVIEDSQVIFINTSTGIAEAQMSPLYIFDSSDAPRVDKDCRYEVEPCANGQYIVTIVVGEDFIASPDTVYPVYVDPTLTFNTNTSTQDAILYSGMPTTAQGSNYYNYIGYYDSNYKIGRLLVKFPGLNSNSTYSSLKATELNSVVYNVYCDGANSPTTITPYIYTGAVWTESTVTTNTATWAGYSSLVGMSGVVVPSKAGDVAFDITSAAKAWKNGTADINKGIMLKNINETNASTCKTFTSTEYGGKYGTHMPYVVVNYTKTPSYNISTLKIFQTYRGPGVDEGNKKAPDMGYNDKTRSAMLSLAPAVNDEAGLYDLPPASSSVLPPQGPEAVKSDMLQLVGLFTSGNASMKTVATSMFNHFLDGTGTDFRNSTLTTNARNHATTQAMVNSTKDIITSFIKANGGNVNAFYNSKAYLDKMHAVRNPVFNTADDRKNGLQICVNDVWGYYVEIKNYSCDGTNYTGTLRYTLFDHFGLDDNDASIGKLYGWTKQFSAWYVLQHYVNVKGAYKPFITYMEFEVPISGKI